MSILNFEKNSFEQEFYLLREALPCFSAALIIKIPNRAKLENKFYICDALSSSLSDTDAQKHQKHIFNLNKKEKAIYLTQSNCFLLIMHSSSKLVISYSL